VIEASLPAVLRERASLQPDDEAVTFVDYDRVAQAYRGSLDD
jgi:fatty acid CoA ligase FadD28